MSFIALQFSESDLVRTFGEAGLVAVTVALIAVLMGVPLLGVLLIRNEGEFVAAVRNMDTALNVLRRFCGWIAVRMVARPGLYSAISLIVVAASVAWLRATAGALSSRRPGARPSAGRSGQPAILT